MALKLFVDVLSNDGKIGMATNHFMMSKNATLLTSVKKQINNKSPIIVPAGRYICCIMFAALNDYAMFFLDLNKSEEQALYAADQYVDSATQKRFMEVFEKVSKEYEEKYNEVQLVFDRNFIPNLSTN